MEVQYRSTQLRKVCEDARAATKKYGKTMAEKKQLRIDQISSAESVETLVRYGIGRCHALKGDRDGQYAMDLTHPYRLVFEKVNQRIVAVEILEIIDYH